MTRARWFKYLGQGVDDAGFRYYVFWNRWDSSECYAIWKNHFWKGWIHLAQKGKIYDSPFSLRKFYFNEGGQLYLFWYGKDYRND